MVPKGWSHTTFDKHVDVLTGFAFKSEGYSNAEDDIRLLRGDNIEPGNLRWHGAKYWSRSELTGLDKYYLLEGDFVIALDRTWISSGLKVAEVTALDLPCLLVQRVARIRARPTLEQSLLRQYFSGHRFEQFVKSVQTATAVPHISPNDIKEFAVCLPPLSEQKKIAKILSTWDQAISTTEQLLANSQQQKKALMQQLLTGKKRLLDKNGVRFCEKFTRYHFSDLLEIDRKSLGSKTDPNMEFDYISLSDVETGTISGALERHTFKTSPSRARRIVSSGDILLATVRPNLQGFAKVREQHEHCIASTGFAVLTPKKGICGDYVYHYLFGYHITGQINALVVGTNYPAINSSDVSGLCIYCPLYEEQVEIAKTLNCSDELIHALQRKLEALKQEKKALMQQLLTGKRRVQLD